MGFIEVQVQREIFLLQIAIKFLQNIQNPPSPQLLQFTAGGADYLVTAINLSGAPQLHNDENAQFEVWSTTAADPDYVITDVNGKNTQVTQDVIIRLAQVQKDPNGNIIGETDVGSYGFHVVFSMLAWISDIAPGPVLAPPHTVIVEMRLDSLEPQFNNQTLLAPLETILSSIAGNVANMQTIQFTGAKLMNVINAGVAADAQLSKIAVRIEYGSGSDWSAAVWTQFYNGSFPDHLGPTNQLSEFIDAWLVADRVQTSLWNSLNQNSDKFRLQGGVTVNWAPSNGTPILNYSFNGDVINACQYPGGASDLNFDITGSVTLGLANQPNTLSAAAYVDWDVHNDLDTAKCAAVIGFEVGVLAEYFGSLIALDLFGFGFLVGVLGVIAIASFYGSVPAPPNCVQISDHQMNCTYQFPLTFGNIPGQIAQASITQISGANDGLVLGGGFSLPLGILSVRIRLALAGKQLNGQGLRSLQSPMPSLSAYLNSLPV